jgi:hypothetical protein
MEADVATERTPTGNGETGIRGDVSVEDTRLNTKGGSMTATLKKPLRDALGAGKRALGVRLDFGKVSGVFLAPARLARQRFQVTRMGERRIVIDLVDDTRQPLDPYEAAFLNVLTEQFKRGERPLATREQAMTEIDALIGKPAATRR